MKENFSQEKPVLAQGFFAENALPIRPLGQMGENHFKHK